MKKLTAAFCAVVLAVCAVFSPGAAAAGPALAATRAYCADCIAHLWEEVKRFDNPHTYYVDLSQKLYDIKQAMLASYARGEH